MSDKIGDLKPGMLEFVAEKLCQSSVFFDCENTGGVRKGKFCQRTQSGANFDDEVFRTDVCLIDNPFCKVAIVQKVLAEAFDR